MPKALKRIVIVSGLSLALLAGCGEDKASLPSELEKARSAYSQGLYLEAEAEYERFIQEHAQHPARWEAWSRLLDITFSVKNDSDKGLILLEAMLLEYGHDQEKSAIVLQQIGDLYADQKQWDKAVEKWAKGRRLAGQDPARQWPFSLRMARAYRAMGIGKYDMAMTYTFMENWDKARKLLEEVTASGELPLEDHAVATFLLADVHIHDGDLEKAKELLESVTGTHPNPLAVDIRIDYLDREIKARKGRPKPVIEMNPEDTGAQAT